MTDAAGAGGRGACRGFWMAEHSPQPGAALNLGISWWGWRPAVCIIVDVDLAGVLDLEFHANAVGIV